MRLIISELLALKFLLIKIELLNFLFYSFTIKFKNGTTKTYMLNHSCLRTVSQLDFLIDSSIIMLLL